MSAVPAITLTSSERWLWFDVDDVITASSPLFQEAMDRWTGQCLPWQGWSHHDFLKLYGLLVDDIPEMLKVWERAKILERAPLLPHVKESMERLSRHDVKLGVITARAWHPEGESITRAMIQRHGLPIDRLIVTDYRESKATILKAMNHNIVGFIDDTVRHVQDCVDLGVSVQLMDQPWNRAMEHTHLPRVQHMADYADWAEARLLTSNDMKPVQSTARIARRRIA